MNMQVVVVGAGTLGMSSALHLAERGARVTVIDADGIASGSSGRSCAVAGCQHVTQLDVDLRAYGLRRIRELASRGLMFNSIGYLRLGRSAGDLALFEKSLAFQRHAGITDARIVDPAGLKKLVPHMSTADLAGGLFGPSDGFLDPPHMCTLMAEIVREKGGTIRQRCRLVGVDRLGVGFRLTTSTDTFDCDAVVLAPGAWAAPVAGLFGQRLPVIPERHEAVIIKLGAPLSYTMPMVMDLVYGGGGTGLNFRHDRPGELLAEVHTAAESNPSDPDDYDQQISEASKEKLAALLLERVPDLPGAGFGRGWAGLYPVSPDGRPFVGAFEGEPRLVAAAGAGGYGIQLGPVIGALAADWVLEGRAMTVPAAASFAPTPERIGG